MKFKKTILVLSLVTGTLLYGGNEPDPVAKITVQGKITSIQQDGGSTYAILTQDGKYAQSKFQVLFMDAEAEEFRNKDILLGEKVFLKGWLIQSPALKKFFKEKSRKLNTKIQYTILAKGEILSNTTKEEKAKLREENQIAQQEKSIAIQNQEAQSHYEQKIKPKKMSPEEAYRKNMQKE